MAVTHNPLIAALADRHYVVAKKSASTQSDSDTDSDSESDTDTDRMDNINLNADIDIDSNIDQEYVEDNNNTDYKIKQRTSMISSSSSGRGSERGCVRGSGNIFRLQSTLCEVLGGEREKEIARMATGGTHAEAALVLAKALLGTNVKLS